jgi:probable DNA repair protein
MQAGVWAWLRRPGRWPVGAKGQLHSHHAVVFAMSAATGGEAGLCLSLRDERLQRQNAGQKQQKRRCYASHVMSLTGLQEESSFSVGSIAYKVSMPGNLPTTRAMTEGALFSLLDDPSQSLFVVTSNPRAARILRIHHSLWQQQRNKTAWPTPQIHTWDAWLEEMWNALLMSGGTKQALLTSAQEHRLWQEVIRSGKDAESSQIWHSDSMAELAQSSQQLLEEYCISNKELEHAASGRDAQAFLSWLKTFQEQCRRRGFLYPSALARSLEGNLEKIDLPLPSEIFLVGFDRITPDQQRLLQKLQQMGCAISPVRLTPEQSVKAAPVVIAADTNEEELYAVAHWIRRQLLQNPGARVGVLTPSITESRGTIDRIFRRVLAPSTLDIHVNAQRLPYEFTLGTPLSQLLQVQSAQQILRWLTQPISFEDASSLLVTGYIGGGTQEARARLDVSLRKNPQLLGGEPDFFWLLRRLREHHATDIRPLQQSMNNLAAVARNAGILAGKSSEKTRRTCAEWREIIDQLLHAADWTVLQTKNSADFQLLERWTYLLDELSMLDAITAPVSFPQMLEILKDATARTIYAKETQDAPVQIMGISESAGLTFDAVWFLNASANAWPARGQAQPWIPWPLQRQAKMPHADMQADYEFSRDVTERILAASGHVVFSFALEDDTEESSATRKPSIAVRISPILQDLFPDNIAIQAHAWLPELIARTDSQETAKTVLVESELSIPFHNAKVRQGVNFLKQQAACPFKAFAELRLAAAAIEDPSVGLAASAQGSALHEVLGKFWSQVKNQTTLRTLSTEQRRRILDSCIEQALSKFAAHDSLEKALLSTEAERLCNRLLEWLDIEERRPDFSVAACEKSIRDASIGGLLFDSRIDRIDNVDGGLALMDYKMGSVKPSACDGDRPDEPQLPAYAVLMRDRLSPDESLRGTAIASLQAKQVMFKIVHSLPQTFSIVDPKNSKRTPILNTQEEMLAQIDTWEHTLRLLAEDFHSGEASVDPKVPGTTCKYCTQKTLCRIVEAQLPPEEDDEETIEEETTAGQET